VSFKLTKAQIAQRDIHVARIKELHEAVNAAIQNLNEELGEVTDFIENIAVAAQDAFDNRSDGWREGERGEAVQGWLDALEAIQNEPVMDETDPLDVIDMLEELSVDPLGDL
jgi:hypothetical protein